MNTEERLALRAAIGSHIKLSGVEIRVIVATHCKRPTRDIVHECLKRFAKSLCGKSYSEQDSTWYANHHIGNVYASVLADFEINLNQRSNRNEYSKNCLG